MYRAFRALCCGLFCLNVFGQTMIDLKTQSKNVDFSSAPSTRPFKSGTALPASCDVGDMFYKTDAPSGSNLYGCIAANTWAVEGQGSTGSAGVGVSMLAQTGDLVVAPTSATALSIGSNCSAATPCNVRFGSAAYSLSSGGTATISGGTGTAFVYIASSGSLTVGHNLTVSCTGNCTAQSGVTSFPSDAVPLFTWSATGGSWDANGGTDLRAFLSTKAVQPGAGLLSIESAGKTTLSTDPTLVGMRTAAPPTSSTACMTGSWAMDASYFYLCLSTGSWRRASLSTW